MLCFSFYSKPAILFFFLFEHAACDDAIKHVKTERTGVITSPNYPSIYPSSADCTVHVQIPTASALHVKFDAFELENRYDSLYYGLGENTDLASAIDSFSGSVIPDPIDLTGGLAWFRFISDGSVEYNGFSLTYTATLGKLT